MAQNYWNKGDWAIVGVNLEEGVEQRLKMARSLLESLGMGVRLMHVEEPIVEQSWRAMMGDAIQGKDVLVQNLEEASIRAGELALNKVQPIFEGMATKTKATVGNPARSLVAEAVSQRAAMIVLGAKQKNYHWWNKAFSTTIQVMGESTVPVLVVGDSSSSNLGQAGMKILLADDLRESSQKVVNQAFDLASKVTNSSLLHLHVNPLTMLAMEGAFDSLARIGRMPYEDISSQEMYEKMNETLKYQMERRVKESRKKLEEKGCFYRSELKSGEVIEEIRLAAKEFRPDLIVYGKHHVWHSAPLGMGHVPFTAMVQEGSSVLMIPTDY